MNTLTKILFSGVLLMLVVFFGGNHYQIQDVAEIVPTASADQWRYQTVQNDDWKFEVGFVDKPYLPYETIWLEISITNISDEVQYKLHLEPGVMNLSIDVFNNQGQQMYKPNIKTCLEIEMVKTIQPHEQIHYYWYLQAYNCVPAKIFYLEPGGYYVDVHFKPFLLSAQGLERTLDTIRSPFEVVAPEGEDSEAYEIFLKFLDERSADRATIPPAFLQLDSEYPDASYTKFAYEFLLFRSGRFYNLAKMEKQQLAILRKQYFAKYVGQLWNPEWNKIREVQIIDSSGNWLPK